jgi:hypothetical protein
MVGHSQNWEGSRLGGFVRRGETGLAASVERAMGQ